MSIKVQLLHPLKIDVAKIASYFPWCRYRGPYTFFGKVDTSEYIVNDNNMDRLQVLFFDDKTHAGFTSITSQYPPEELAVLFSLLPTALSEPLIAALEKTKLEIPKKVELTLLDVLREKACPLMSEPAPEFGAFWVPHRPLRTGRNPATGKEVHIKSTTMRRLDATLRDGAAVASVPAEPVGTSAGAAAAAGLNKDAQSRLSLLNSSLFTPSLENDKRFTKSTIPGVLYEAFSAVYITDEELKQYGFKMEQIERKREGLGYIVVIKELGTDCKTTLKMN